jgi:hypothetical protein
VCLVAKVLSLIRRADEAELFRTRNGIYESLNTYILHDVGFGSVVWMRLMKRGKMHQVRTQARWMSDMRSKYFVDSVVGRH